MVPAGTVGGIGQLVFGPEWVVQPRSGLERHVGPNTVSR